MTLIYSIIISSVEREEEKGERDFHSFFLPNQINFPIHLRPRAIRFLVNLCKGNDNTYSNMLNDFFYLSQLLQITFEQRNLVGLPV